MSRAYGNLRVVFFVLDPVGLSGRDRRSEDSEDGDDSEESEDGEPMLLDNGERGVGIFSVISDQISNGLINEAASAESSGF